MGIGLPGHINSDSSDDYQWREVRGRVIRSGRRMVDSAFETVPKSSKVFKKEKHQPDS